MASIVGTPCLDAWPHACISEVFNRAGVQVFKTPGLWTMDHVHSRHAGIAALVLTGTLASPAPLTVEELRALTPVLSVTRCSGHGTWRQVRSGVGACTCEQGWAGTDCSEDACEQMLCAGRAHCELGICRCDAGFLAPDCAVDSCPGHFPQGSALGCHGAQAHGACVHGVCHCNPGWAGVACEQDTCPDHCNGRGQCHGGACACERGWGGAACDRPACPAGCSRRGRCVGGGVCECVEGWGGDACECPSGLPTVACSAHGTCTAGGACACEHGWSGADCATTTTSLGDS